MACKVYRKLLVDKSPKGGTQTNSYIVIHNIRYGTAKGCYDWFNECLHGRGRDGVATHYTIDDKEGYQMLEDNWGAIHCGDGNKSFAEWGSGIPGIGDHNAIGIEVGDGESVDKLKAIENCIELVRYLMKTYNIPLSNVVRHGDVADSGCPETIMKLGKWQYMKDEIAKRNAENKAIGIDISALKPVEGMTANSTATDTGSAGTSGDALTGATIQLTFNDTTTVQESLPNANVSDNWVDMHEIKGITLHMYPPYHNCTADSMAKYFSNMGWNRNFHYKLDKDTKIDFDKKPVSGQTTGGNIVGSSESDFEVTPKDPLYSGVSIGVGGGSSSDGATPGATIDGSDVPSKIYNYCVSQGCSCAAACGILGCAQQESNFIPTNVNKVTKAYGLFQWLNEREDALIKKAKAAGKEKSDVDIQIQHMWAEFCGEDALTLSRLNKRYGGLDGFKKMTDPKKAAAAFAVCFERAEDGADTTGIRGKYAQQWYDKFSSAAGTASVASAGLMVRAMTDDDEPFGWPVPSQQYIQAYFGYRKDILGYSFHPGIDIVNMSGYGMYCYAKGTVKKVMTDTKLAGYVRIDHGNGLQTVYASLSDIYVQEGDEVVGGQCIGITGTTIGNGLMHAHFEMLINGEHVDPLKYVEPGGGNRDIPSEYYGVAAMDISDTDENITWDNIDKGRICFASADNNTHTYIDSNLFNNQHPKYTLSVGAFFYDEFDLVEKTGKVDWPKTEKKLIQQCAKALYDEGFTSQQLWREFDLNRAPSPFLYLDKDKWRAFCKEVDKQVEWLNTKYGKVTATYVPNELLQDSNDNIFIETAPDGGILDATTGGGNTGAGVASVANGLFIGDSWGVGIKEMAEAEGATVEAVIGKTFQYFYHKSKNVDRLKGMKKDPSFIYIYLGTNDLATNIKYQYCEQFFDRVATLWPNIPIYVGKLVGCGTKWSNNKYNTYVTAEAWNKAAKEFNNKLSTICTKKGFNLIDVSDGLVDSKGFINDSMQESDGLHLKTYDKYFANIKAQIGAVGSSSSAIDGTQTGEGIGGKDASQLTEDIRDLGYNPAHMYGYVILNKGCKFYQSGNTASKVLDTLPFGQEFYIISGPSNSIFFHARVAGKTGYIRKKNCKVIKSYSDKYAFGQSYKSKIGSPCTLFPSTRLYSKPDINGGSIKTYSSRVSGKVLDYSGKLVDDPAYKNKAGQFYRVQIGTTNTKGWVKAYRVAFSDPIASSIEEPQVIDDITVFESTPNAGKYCYIADTTVSVDLLKDAKEGADVVASLAVGDELLIESKSGSYYYCTFGGKKGYVSMYDVQVIKSGHGEVNNGYVNSNCWILYDSTELYDSNKLSKSVATLNEQDQCVVLAADSKLGLYRIQTGSGDGWVKAYAVTFDKNEFKIKLDGTTNSTLVGSPEQVIELTNVNFTNGDFEGGDTGWEKLGTLNFDITPNGEWGSENHWPYRGNQFARIRNLNNELAGITKEFSIPEDSNEGYLRILFYVKQVTQDDFNNGTIVPDSLKKNNIYVKLLDKNNKVKYEKEIQLGDIGNNTWSRVGCVVNAPSLTEYKLFIGNKKKFDLLIDDVTIEQIFDMNSVIGDSNSTSGLTSSGAGATSIDNGGVMVYEVGSPTNAGASQPSISTVITQEEYEQIMNYSTAAYIDTYTNSFEIDDKDLTEAKTVGVKDDSRLEVLTEEMKTFTDNMIRYKVIETGPGSVDHCVKPVDELNVLIKNVECNVDPIYPDLIVPPKYTTSTYDAMSKNSIPLATVEDATADLADTLDKSYSYEYTVLDKKEKKSSGKPINYMDPYPYDDKITDLENHYPKVLIDEIESRMYSCNHPGCPIAHPMAKNFAMLNDMAIRQSKATEQRLVRLENILATMTRYLGRMSSRMNINCVYYGGQTVLGKYKCIRCLRDDRVHDGATVTMDQCLTCTRYEPIIGQMYDILDETGFNGSAILDDMQMSYMTLDDMKNLNQVENRNTVYDYINVNKKEKEKPASLIDDWQKADKDAQIKSIKKSVSGKANQEAAIAELKPSDYLFMMDWTEESVDLQRPDVKAYPTEKIAAKYKNQAGDPQEENTASAEKSVQMGTDDTTYDAIASGDWIDTREVDDSTQLNKYTSLDFYFENFNLNRTGYEYDNGLKGNVGMTASGTIGSSVNGNGAEIRNKICEMALTIHNEHKNNDANYSNSPRTIDHDKPQRVNGTIGGMKNPIGYDCTSLVSCCYKAAGLSNFYNGHTGQGSVANNSLVQDVLKKGGKIWYADTAGMAQALPGDVLMSWKGGKLDKNKIADGSGCKASHAMIYMGDGKIIHASKPAAAPDGIKYEKADYYITGSHAGHSFFLRPQSLIDADAQASSSSGGGVIETPGTIDGVSYVAKLCNARCTEYGTWEKGMGAGTLASGKSWSSYVNKCVASHNLPYGTKIYIPKLKGVVNKDGMFTVEDTGGHCFDFDVATSPKKNSAGFYDAYIVSYGSGPVAASFTAGKEACDKSFGANAFESSFKEYMKYGGCLIKFSKFSSKDANASWWKKY